MPSTAVGGNAQWIRPFGSHLVSIGSDVRRVDGETHEDFRFLEGSFTRRRRAGGEQHLVGLYGEDSWALFPRLRLSLAARGDLWRSVRVFRHERSLENGEVLRDDRPSDRDRLAFSPKVALIHRATERLSLRGSFYEGFRAPTLNELVRPFRVRNDITEANPGLDPERLLGGEVGADYGVSRLRGRVTGFWNELDDPIVNVTIGEGPATIEPCGFVPEGGVCRQRQNLDRSRVRGLETEIEIAPARAWLASVSYLLSDAEVTEAPSQPDLEGKRIAQVPRHQVVVKLAYDTPDWLSAAVQI
ncbi:MAG: TonB-dependent receptor plug domain-containing protein, partial [Candidatus Binatia bacterium]